MHYALTGSSLTPALAPIEMVEKYLPFMSSWCHWSLFLLTESMVVQGQGIAETKQGQVHKCVSARVCMCKSFTIVLNCI